MKKLADLIEMTVLVVAGCVAMFGIVAVAIGAAMMIVGVAKAEGYDSRDNRWATQRFFGEFARPCAPISEPIAREER